MISAEWAAQNALLHQQSPSFGSQGWKGSRIAKRYAKEYGCASILDYGCGKGGLREALGARVRNYDPAIPQWSAPPDPADMVMCRDVMEHVEPEHMDAVLGHIAGLAQKVAVFLIACRFANQSMPNGSNTHISVHPAAWWEGKLREWFRVVEASCPEKEQALFVCQRKEER